MTEISQAAKERARAMLREADPREERRDVAVWIEDTFAKYIDKVSGIAKRAKVGLAPWDELESIIVTDKNPIERAISSMAMPLDAERYGREIGESLRHLGYKIVKDDGA